MSESSKLNYTLSYRGGYKKGKKISNRKYNYTSSPSKGINKYPHSSKNVSIFTLIPFLIYGGMLKYLYDIESNAKCSCVLNDYTLKLKNLITYWFVVSLLSLCLMICDVNTLKSLQMFMGLVSLGIVIYTIYVFYKFEYKLIESKCKCAEDYRKTIFKYYMLFVALALLLQVFLVFLYIYMIYSIRQQMAYSVVKTNL